MFIVFNKQKIYSYLVAFSTVVALFVFSVVIAQSNTNTILTSANGKELPIYEVNTEQKKVALTINCAWLQLPMG